MNLYKDQCKKYSLLSKIKYDDYSELVDMIEQIMVRSNDNPKANAIILFGFPGNGKTDWIKRFALKNPDYKIVSFDDDVWALRDKYNQEPTDEEVMDCFGKDLEASGSNGKNIIIDGTFLDLVGRCALTDTLKLYGYQVNLVDITSNFDRAFNDNVYKTTIERLGYVPRNIREVYSNHKYANTYNRLYEYVEYEKRRCKYDEQIAYGVVGLGVDNVFNWTTPYEEITRIRGRNK